MCSNGGTEQVAWECRGGSPKFSLASQRWDHLTWVLKNESLFQAKKGTENTFDVENGHYYLGLGLRGLCVYVGERMVEVRLEIQSMTRWSAILLVFVSSLHQFIPQKLSPKQDVELNLSSFKNPPGPPALQRSPPWAVLHPGCTLGPPGSIPGSPVIHRRWCVATAGEGPHSYCHLVRTSFAAGCLSVFSL